MEEPIQSQPEQAFVEIVEVQFRPGQKIYYFDPAGLECHAGDHVIIDTARGPEYGICASDNRTVKSQQIVAPLRPVLRRATPQDLRTVEENRKKEQHAFAVCQQKIAEHGLDMQLVAVEYAFDGSKLLFFFTADERVDFRELVKNLAGIFHTRIELRQIGVRDKAKMVGGLGICGRPFCCATFLNEFQPVSIKMAKVQNLSLNPTKISGTCGRLMCCLKYEQEAYEDLLRTTPRNESFVDTPQGRGTVVEVDLLRQRVKVRMEEQSDTVNTFAVSEIAVLRNGKAKKTDAPIPEDLAPISGNGKRAAQPQPEAPLFPETIRFRYRTDSVVEDAPDAPELPDAPAPDEAEGAPAKPKRHRNRRYKPAASAPQSPQPDAPAAAADKPRRSHRPKPNRRRPRPDGAAGAE